MLYKDPQSSAPLPLTKNQQQQQQQHHHTKQKNHPPQKKNRKKQSPNQHFVQVIKGEI